MMPALVFLAYDPNAVRPGWIALGLVTALGIATYLLWRSMNTQLGNIQMPPRGAPPPSSDEDSDGDVGTRTAEPDDRRPSQPEA